MTTRALEDSEIKAIFGYIDGCNAERNRSMLICGIGMALRASELVGLKVSDVYDVQKVKTYVTIRAETAKFNKGRTIRIGDDILSTIASFISWKIEHGESIKPEAPLFRSQKGGQLTRIALYEIVKKIFDNAGIDQSPHCLRKTGATIYYIESDYDLIATQQFLGHADPSTTRRYIGLTTEQIVEYAEKLSDHLFSAIHNGKIEKSNTVDNMSRVFLDNISDEKLIFELIQRGYAVSEQQREKKAEIIQMPKIA